MLTALTGMNAARLRMDVVADNVANLNNPDHVESRVVQSARPDQTGTDARINRTGNPVSLDREMVEMVEAKHQYTANAQVIRIKSDMQSHLLDILA